jgi:nucleolar protein 53
MGRRLRGASLRAKKRGDETAIAMMDTTAGEAETQQVVEQTNDELFVLDTTAVLPSKKQSDRKEAKQTKHKQQTVSKTEEGKIQKLVDTHGPTKLQQLVKQGQKTSKSAHRKGRVNPNFDLWGKDEEEDEETTANGPDRKRQKKQPAAGPVSGIVTMHIRNNKVQPTTAAALKPTSKTISIDVARSGQSYNPDELEHQKVLQEALQIELNRQQAEKAKKAPLAAGMSAETRALLIVDSSEDSSSENEEEEEDNDETMNDASLDKKREKFTRAQRNKQKRVRAEEAALKARKLEKKIQNSVAESKTIIKKLKKEEVKAQQRKDELDAKKQAAIRVKGKDVLLQLTKSNPLEAPTLPVALPSELRAGTSLRTIKAKGSLITDRMTSLMDRDMATKKQLKKRKRVEGKKRKIKVHGKGHEMDDLMG